MKPIRTPVSYVAAALACVLGCSSSGVTLTDPVPTWADSGVKEAPDVDSPESAPDRPDVSPERDSGPTRVDGEVPDGAMPTDSGPDAAQLTFSCANPTSPPTCPANDCYERASGPNNNDYVRATPLAPGAEVEGVLCGTNDWDIYRVEVPIGCKLDVTAKFQHSAGDIDTYISTRYRIANGEDPNAWQITDDIAIGDSIDDDEQTHWVSRTNEPHYVRIVDKGGKNNSYRLQTTVTCPSHSCPADDAMEALGTGAMGDNNSQPRATPMIANDTVKGILCGNDDWYSFHTLDFGGTCKPFIRLEFDANQAVLLDVREGVLTPASARADTSRPGVIEVEWGANNTLGAADLRVYGPTGARYSLYATCEHLRSLR